MKHFLDLLNVTRKDLEQFFTCAAKLKSEPKQTRSLPLKGYVLGLVFEKPSLRTRVSFQSAMSQLGGDSIFLSGQEAGLGTREIVPDYAKVVTSYVDALVIRTFTHETVCHFAANASCPVINGLSDYYHPCQAVADLFTIKEHRGNLKNATLAFIGDGNNVSRSLAIACALLDVNFILSCPKEYDFDPEFRQLFQERFPKTPLVTAMKPKEAVAQADAIYTDVWTSMGQEQEKKARLKAFSSYQLNEDLMSHASPKSIVMHCLPAHRGEEITDGVIDSKQSIVFTQAANRLHIQKALLLWLLRPSLLKS